MKGKPMEPEITDDELCYECSGLGDDYYIDENGELICACDTCPLNPYNSYLYRDE